MLNSDNNNRKRKQDENTKILSSSLPNTSSWSDFIYSSPSSPSNTDEHQQFNFDSFFEQQHLHVDFPPSTTHSGANSRRHSVAVGEMDFHSFDFLKQDINVLPSNDNAPWDDLQQLLNSTTNERPIHRRTLSLREDNPHYATLLSPALSTNSSSSNFFSPSFLDALVAENNNVKENDAATIVSDISMMDTTPSTDLLSQSNDFLKLANAADYSTITPSAITNEINSMADWLLEQQEAKALQEKAQKRQKRSSLSPVSPTQTLGSSMSSNSPSPPITPMQPASLGFEPISFQQRQQNEDWNMKMGGLISARMLQGETMAPSLKPLIQEYLLRRDHQDRSLPVTGERTVMVLTSRVAQKSYGTEKRFLCPPPTTILKGANWWTNSGSDKPNLLTEPKKSNFFQSPTYSGPKLTIHISGETINQNGVLEWQTPQGTIIDTSAACNQNPLASISGRCVSKQLYINDADEKRKRVEVLAKIQLGNGLQLGTFPSKGIKVISKPSKKRQSIKNMELCIHHGTTISLFNRIRSQTVSTKYLGVSSSGDNSNNGTCFVARTGSWDPFVIWIVDTNHTPETAIPRSHHPHHPDFPPPPAIALQTPSSAQQPNAVHYNQPVVLQCVTTGLVSPVMIIRKVDKGSMVLGGNRTEDYSEKTGGECGDETLGDPVSQLHKVAFQIVQDPSFAQHQKTKQPQQQTKTMSNYRIPQSCHPVTYLACLNDVVGMHKTTYTRHLVPSCQPASKDEKGWTDMMEESSIVPAVPRRRMSSISSTETKGRRGSLADRRGSTITDSSGLEGACWTEDVSDAAIWTIVGTDCASYTFWTPSEAPDQSCFNMPFNLQATTTLSTNSAPITPFPIVFDVSMKKTDNMHLIMNGENLTRDLSIWFGDIKSPLTEYKSRDSIICEIPELQELLNSPTLTMEEDGMKKKLPLLLVRGDGVVYRTNQFYIL